MGHTKGPWDFNDIFQVEGMYSVSAVCEQNGFVNPRIAEILTDHCLDSEAVANARLIASAPDLLEVCENALWHLGDHNSGRATLRTDELVPFIQKAISKAKGGE